MENLQFDKAEYAGEAPSRTCGECTRLIHDQYFEAAGKLLCATCAQGLAGGGSAAGAFVRALVWGGGAAFLGTLVWFAFIKITGWELGLIAIAIGFLVGFAVRKASRGRGGWKYQALAMALTYVSITAAYVPMVIKSFAAEGKSQAAQAAVNADVAPSPWAASPPAVMTVSATTPAADPAVPSTDRGGPVDKPTAGTFVLFAVIVFAIAFAAPFLAGFENIFGIIIVGFALYEAWKLNKRVVVSGPFTIAAPPPAQG